MSHSLSQQREEVEAIYKGKIGDTLQEVLGTACQGKVLGCAKWGTWKSQFKKDIETIAVPVFHDPKFTRCLEKENFPDGPKDKDRIRQTVERDLQELLKDNSEKDRFLRAIAKEEVLWDGSKAPEPAYKNPCGQFYSTDMDTLLDSDNKRLLAFFSNEYSCAEEKGECKTTDCFKNAIEEASALENDFYFRYLFSGSKYSGNKELYRLGYAEDIGEDMADNIGETVLARVLARTPKIEERRAKFLDQIANLCEPPSVRSFFPKEAVVQHKFTMDSHTISEVRRQKLLTRPIREALSCAKDFVEERAECEF